MSAHPGQAATVQVPALDAAQFRHLDELRALGYTLIDSLATAATIDRVSTELAPWFEQTPRCQGDFYGWQTTRINAVPLKAPASHALILEPRILALIHEVLGAQCDWFQLNLAQAIRVHPGERQQVPHRDDEMWPCAKGGVEYMVNVMWALDDFTADNGATRLWPRSLHRRMPRAADPTDSVPACMSRGSALLYLGSTTHCAGANRSASPRTGLVISYALGWLRPYELAFLAYPPAVARTFPPALRALLGYRLHRPNLGHYEGQDPAVIFETESRHLPTTDGLPETIAAELREFYAASAE
jgi:ectoine hydroxylase-related dioxygenase (phytanoyl-CoA dioxygenase family)